MPWTHKMIEDSRLHKMSDLPAMSRIVVGIDPAATSGEDSDYTGIVVVGKSHEGHLYVLEDCTLKGSPHACMTRAVDTYHRWKADRIVSGVNNGGDYVGTVLTSVDPNVPYRSIRATRTRTDPICALWKQGRGHIVGVLPQLEDELCSYVPGDESKGKHDDRMDAMVWAAHELNVGAAA